MYTIWRETDNGLLPTSMPTDAWRRVAEVIESATRLGTRCTPSGARLVGHVPHVAPEAYLHVMFAPLDERDIAQLETGVGRPLPQAYRAFLRLTNGLSLFSDSLSIYGLRRTHARRGDDVWHPFSAVPPNTGERPPGLPPGAVVVGSYGDDGSTVHMLPDGTVRMSRRDDSTPLRHWPELLGMLADEAVRMASFFDGEGRAVGIPGPTAPPPKSSNDAPAV